METDEDRQSSPVMSTHANRRATQRCFQSDQIAYIVQHGRLLRRTGIQFYFLAERDVPPDDRRLAWVQRLIGATLLVSPEGDTVITLYKNRKALRDIRKKTKYWVA